MHFQHRKLLCTIMLFQQKTIFSKRHITRNSPKNTQNTRDSWMEKHPISTLPNIDAIWTSKHAKNALRTHRSHY